MLDVTSHLIDPRIGVLVREGHQLFYACIDGEFPERDTAQEVLDLLHGIKRDVSRVDSFPEPFIVTRPDYELTYHGKSAKAISDWEVFNVTIRTLDIYQPRPDVIRVLAPSGPAAIRCVREYVREEMIWGRHDGRIEYSADRDD